MYAVLAIWDISTDAEVWITVASLTYFALMVGLAMYGLNLISFSLAHFFSGSHGFVFFSS